MYIWYLVRAQFWKCVRFSDFFVTLGLRSQISDDSSGEISLDDKRFCFESKSLERGQTFCRRKKTVWCIFIFLRNYSINYFRCFLWCGPKADKEKQRCRRTQSRDRGCHQKSIFSLRFPVRAAFCGPFFLIFALIFVMWVFLLTFDMFCVFWSTLKFFRIKKHFFENFPLEIVRLCHDFDQFSLHICLVCNSHVFIPISCLCVVVFAVMDWGLSGPILVPFVIFTCRRAKIK